MPSAQFAARIVSQHFPDARVELERGALDGQTLGSYNSNPEGKLTVTETGSGVRVAQVVQAHVTEEIAPGPGLDELNARLAAFAEGLRSQ
jgi:hypothetical protein